MATSVLITRQPDNHYTARALVLPEIVVTGATEAEAVEQLRVALADLQQHSRVIQVELPLTDTAGGHPWLRFAGMWEHDPDWEAFEAAVTDLRRADTPDSPTV
jgi:predicted RNase H-like HicB family nuclease